MKNIIISLTLLIFLLSSYCYSQKPGTGNSSLSPQGAPIRAYLNLNNISTIFKNTGISDINITESRSGFVFPKESGKTAVFISGFLWGTLISGDPQPRVGGSAYREGLQGGKILSPGVPEDTSLSHIRIYRVRPDVYPGGPTAGVAIEAEDEGKSEAEIRAQYELDWVEWRAQDGAPFDDVDSNGLYDPNIDVPGVPGASQTIWFVANDLNPTLTTDLYGAQPIGIEYQATYWAYRNTTFIDDIIFRKYKLINKSLTPFNDMYITMWSDPDIGDASEDFVGCDTTLGMVYAYNAFEDDAVYDPLPPPAIGFDLLKGPTVQGNENLPMTAAYYFPLGEMPPHGFIQSSMAFYNYMKGTIGFTGDPFIDPTTGLETKFALNGDPLTGEGWIDGILNGPGDRQLGLASGPFNMAIGDTQEIVVAELAALGLDRLHSIQILKSYSNLVQFEYDNGFPLVTVPRPQKPVVTVDDADRVIELNWGTNNASVSAIENFNQDGYTFQGYNLYQLQDAVPYLQNELKIATYDIIDGITEIQGMVTDSITGLLVFGIQQNGSDSGIERMFSTNYDYIKNENMKVGKKYYYAVTAYTYNPDTLANPRSSETIFNIIEAIYYDDLPGAGYGDIVLVEHTEGLADANIEVTIDDPTKITGDDYKVFFTQRAEIRNENGDWVAASNVLRKSDPNDPDTLTGTSIDIAAVYGIAANNTVLHFHLDVVHHYYGWVDGVILTFPDNVTIIASPPFRASGGMVEPEIIGQNIHYGVTDNSATGYGIFHDGGEDWIVIVSTISPPMAVDWTAFDDGYAGGGPPETGTTVLTEVGFESRVAQYWNIFDLTIDMMALENQSIVNNYYMYPPRDDFPEYFGHVEAPIVDGFQINADINYGAPLTIGRLTLDGEPIASNMGQPYGIQDYTVFGVVPATAANSSLGIGTDQLELLQKDYELRYTGAREIINIDGNNVEITAEGGGSIATLYGARGYNIADHPLNPNPGSSEPFTIRIPFEVWSIDEQRQVNFMIYDRIGNPTNDDPFRVWNTEGRMYTAFVLSDYQETVILLTDPILPLAATWNLVWWVNEYETGDIVRVYYNNPVITGSDTYMFTTPEAVDTVREFIPTDYLLFQNYPNPFNPTTTIRFDLPKQGLVKLEVYDILGQRVAQLLNTEMQVGRHEIDFSGNILASGVYIYVLNVRDKFFEAKKMILLK